MKQPVRRWVKRVLCVVLLALVPVMLAACGGDSTSMSDAAASTLHAHVAAVRAAVTARDATGAARALDELRASVDQLRRHDDLAPDRAREILVAATQVRSQLVAITTTTTTTTTMTTTTAPPPPAKGHGAGEHGNGQGNGPGKEQRAD
jgi:hypothetical protein